MGTLTQYELAWELYRAGLNGEQIGLRVERDRATVYRWLSGIKKLGIREFVRRKKECKRRRQARVLSPLVRSEIIAIRKKWKWCGQKIQKELKEHHGIQVSLMSIYRVLHTSFTIKVVPYRERGERPHVYTPRARVEHDTVCFGEVFAYTAVDVFTKEPTVIMGTNLSMETGAQMFCLQSAYYGETVLHQSDQGPEFGHLFRKAVEDTGSIHRYSRPYKKNDQAHIENFNRSLRAECLGWGKYRKEDIDLLQARVDIWLHHWMYERWHMGLPDMQTPAQFTTSWYAEHNQIYHPVAFAL